MPLGIMNRLHGISMLLLLACVNPPLSQKWLPFLYIVTGYVASRHLPTETPWPPPSPRHPGMPFYYYTRYGKALPNMGAEHVHELAPSARFIIN